jgi:hypothetical protein
MTGRFPPDIFVIVLVPFMTLALGVLLTRLNVPLLMVVLVNIALCLAVAWITIVLTHRRRHR